MSENAKAKLVGVNHVALEVGDIDDALAFYGRIFAFELRGRSDGMAFIDMGDQFLALSAGRSQAPDEHRHFGLVVDDRSAVRQLAREAGAEILPGNSLDFLDPWGNRIQVVEYRDIQFTKSPEALRKLSVTSEKSPSAIDELKRKGLVR